MKYEKLSTRITSRTMDDPRFEWIRERVNLSLDVKDSSVFEDLLERDDGLCERELAKFLNETPEEAQATILFYKIVKEEEEEVEVDCGMEISVSFVKLSWPNDEINSMTLNVITGITSSITKRNAYFVLYIVTLGNFSLLI